MKELALYNLKEGMVLAKDITTPSGQVVLEKGKELTKQSILRLSFYNIKSACIVDGEEKQAAPKSYSQKIKTSQKFQSFQVDHTIVLSQIRVSFEGYVNEGRPLDTAALLSKVVELFQSCKTSLELFNMLHNVWSPSPYSASYMLPHSAETRFPPDPSSDGMPPALLLQG